MKTIEFTQHADCYRKVTLVIKDEELFRQKCQEWVEEGQTLSHYDMEESFFEDSVEVEYSEWDWSEEDNDEFYEVMLDENIPTDEDQIDEE
jgi:hypothetical protein